MPKFSFKELFSRKKPPVVAEEETTTSTESYVAQRIKRIKEESSLYYGFEQDIDVQKEVINDAELLSKVTNACINYYSEESFIALDEELKTKILLEILQNHRTNKNAMQIFLERYKDNAQIIESAQFIDLINEQDFKYIKEVLADYANNFEISENVSKAIKRLEKNVDFYYKNKEMGFLFGRAIGLNVYRMTADNAKSIVDDEIRRQKNGDYDQPLTEEQLMLVRVTDVFPQDMTIKPHANTNAAKDYLSVSNKLEKAVRDEVYQKYGMTYDQGEILYTGTIQEQEQLRLELINNSVIDENTSCSQLAHTINIECDKKEARVSVRMYRETLHFALNAAVSEHMFGNAWNSMPFAIMEPLSYHKNEVENLRPEDSWVGGNMKLQQPTILMEEIYLKKLIERAKTDKSILSTLKNCEIVVISPTNDVMRSEFVSAVLLSKGCPAYRCHNFFVTNLDAGTGDSARNIYDAIDKVIGEVNSSAENENQIIGNFQHSNTNRYRVEGVLTEKFINIGLVEFGRKVADALQDDQKGTELYGEIEKYKYIQDGIDEVYKYNNSKKDNCPIEVEQYQQDICSKNFALNKLITTILDDNFEVEEIKRLINEYNSQFRKELGKQYGKSVILTAETDIDKIKAYREDIKQMREQNNSL